MLLQKSQIGKTAVILIILILLAALAAMPLFLQADMAGENTPEANLYLPIIYNEDGLTPDPGLNSTPTPTSSHTPTATSTATDTAIPASGCNLQFAQEAYGNSPYVLITGDVGKEVTITNLTTNEVIGSGILDGPVVGQDCPGFSYITVSPRLDETNVGHTLLAQETDNPDNFDTTIVLDAYNPQPTSTPNAPYLAVVPSCGTGPDVQFKVEGNNWPTNQSLTLSWEGVPQIVFEANEHTGFFIMTWEFNGLNNGIYTVSALSGANGVTASDQIYIPCATSTQPPTNTSTPTNTPTATSTPTVAPPCNYGPHSVPLNGSARIQMEDFRCGGPDVSFSDQNDGGPGSGAYRIDYGAEGPDLEGTSDIGGGYNLGWTQAGEWLEYEISAPAYAVYTFIIRYATPNTTNPRLQIRTTFGTLVNNTPILSLPPTDGFQDWQNYETQVLLFSGTNIVRFTIAGGPGNYNYFDVQPFIPTSTPTPVTPTPAPADLIVGQPILVSTPPLTSYEPIAFQVPITNTGDLSIETLFFVDLLFDPAPTFGSDTYTAVSGLAGNSSKTLTITSTTGLDADLGTHQITAWVDSLNHVVEEDETNNLSTPLELVNVTPANTPTPTAVPIGTEPISGLALTLTSELLPIERAHITLIEEASGIPIASTYSDENGAYSLNNIPTDTSYTVQACIFINNQPYFGLNTGVTAPNAFANVILLPQPCP